MTTVQERKRKERRARREHIQAAAREVFVERGFAKTSIEQVARASSLSVGAIYLYFRSKEDLYVSLLEQTLARFDADLTQVRTDASASGHGYGGLQMVWSSLIEWAVSDVEGTRVLGLLSRPGVRAQLSDDVAEQVGAGVRTLIAHLSAVIRDGVNAGQYRAVDADETAAVLWATFLGLLEAAELRRNLTLEAPSFTDSAQAALAAFEAGIRAPMARVAEAA